MAVCPVGQSPASLRQPSQCQMCGVCTHDPGARGITTTVTPVSPRLPGLQEFGRTEGVLSLLLLGLMAADSVRMTQLFARYQQFALPYLGYNYRLTVVLGVSVLVGTILLLQLCVARLLGGRVQVTGVAGAGDSTGVKYSSAGKALSSSFDSMAFSFLPLTLGVFLSLSLQHLWSGAWPSLQTVLLESRLIDWSGHMPPTNVYFVSIPLKFLQLALLGMGLYFSLGIARKDMSAGALSRSAVVLAAFSGFGFLFLLPMSGACSPDECLEQ